MTPPAHAYAAAPAVATKYASPTYAAQAQVTYVPSAHACVAPAQAFVAGPAVTTTYTAAYPS